MITLKHQHIAGLSILLLQKDGRHYIAAEHEFAPGISGLRALGPDPDYAHRQFDVAVQAREANIATEWDTCA